MYTTGSPAKGTYARLCHYHERRGLPGIVPQKKVSIRTLGIGPHRHTARTGARRGAMALVRTRPRTCLARPLK